jgi:hypothetical protein
LKIASAGPNGKSKLFKKNYKVLDSTTIPQRKKFVRNSITMFDKKDNP